jgi:hypothetical protein
MLLSTTQDADDTDGVNQSVGSPPSVGVTITVTEEGLFPALFVANTEQV